MPRRGPERRDSGDPSFDIEALQNELGRQRPHQASHARSSSPAATALPVQRPQTCRLDTGRFMPTVALGRTVEGGAVRELQTSLIERARDYGYIALTRVKKPGVAYLAEMRVGELAAQRSEPLNYDSLDSLLAAANTSLGLPEHVGLVGGFVLRNIRKSRGGSTTPNQRLYLRLRSHDEMDVLETEKSKLLEMLVPDYVADPAKHGFSAIQIPLVNIRTEHEGTVLQPLLRAEWPIPDTLELGPLVNFDIDSRKV